MENDSIRASGNNTLVDIWINGKLRSICITHEAIGAFVGFDTAAEFSEDGSGTTIVFQHTGDFSLESIEEHTKGWANVLKTLSAHLESVG